MITWIEIAKRAQCYENQCICSWLQNVSEAIQISTCSHVFRGQTGHVYCLPLFRKCSALQKVRYLSLKINSW